MTPDEKHPVIPRFKPYFEAWGYSFETFTIDGKVHTRFIAPNGASWLTRNARVNYPFFDMASRVIADNKHLTHELCQINGISVPQSYNFDAQDYDDDKIAQLLTKGPIVIKPSNARLSWGVALNIQSLDEAKIAINNAQAFDNTIVAQQQVTGDEIRFAVLNGKVEVALLRQTPRVIGDGLHTISQLLQIENEDRAKLQLPYADYPQLDDQNIDVSTIDTTRIPVQDEVVEFSRATMIRDGASMYNITDMVHQSYKEIALKAVNALGVPFTVVDIMIQDFNKPADKDNYALIEFNSAPALGLFYSCRDGKQYDMIPVLAKLIDSSIRGRHL